VIYTKSRGIILLVKRKKKDLGYNQSLFSELENGKDNPKRQIKEYKHVINIEESLPHEKT